MAILARAIYKKGVLHPKEPLDIGEQAEVELLIFPIRQDTLADVLGFDPSDTKALAASAERHRRAILRMAGTASSDEPHDGSVHHDRYIYTASWR
ncbi:MAG: antitoxin family protein [Chloroflexota bacterium]|nr:antitoxin family protein [Chloroflexota bacterium]